MHIFTLNVIYFGFRMEEKSFPKIVMPFNKSKAFWKMETMFLGR